jgi:hypothetical protein
MSSQETHQERVRRLVDLEESLKNDPRFRELEIVFERTTGNYLANLWARHLYEFMGPGQDWDVDVTDASLTHEDSFHLEFLGNEKLDLKTARVSYQTLGLMSNLKFLGAEFEGKKRTPSIFRLGLITNEGETIILTRRVGEDGAEIYADINNPKVAREIFKETS